MSEDGFVTLEFDEFVCETDLARGYRNEGAGEPSWFPKSVHEWDERQTKDVEIFVREWFAEKEGYI